MGNTVRINWHQGFYGGIELELRDYRDILDFDTEHELSKQPIRMDMLIVKKTRDVEIVNPVARIFRKHNNPSGCADRFAGKHLLHSPANGKSHDKGKHRCDIRGKVGLYHKGKVNIRTRR